MAPSLVEMSWETILDAARFILSKCEPVERHGDRLHDIYCASWGKMVRDNSAIPQGATQSLTFLSCQIDKWNIEVQPSFREPPDSRVPVDEVKYSI